MFIRIYTSLLISILLATVSCYGLYKLQYGQRYNAHASSILSGSFELISVGLARHSGEKRKQWLNIVEKLTATPLVLQTHTSKNKQVNALGEVKKESSMNIYLDDEQHVQVDVVSDEGFTLSANIEQISEQHYRLMAILILNELGRVPVGDQVSALQGLAAVFPPSLTFTLMHELTLDPQQLSRVKRGDVVVNERIDDEGRFSWVYARLAKSDNVLVIGPIASFEAMPIRIITFMLALSIFITASMAYILVRGLERRLGKIDGSMQRFNAGKDHKPVIIKGQDGIANLANTINAMALRIGRLVKEQSEISQAVSHELRTPISRMKFRLHALLEGDISEQQEKQLLGLSRDMNEIDSLIDEILMLQQAQHQQDKTNIKLNGMIDSLLSLHALQFTQVNHQFIHNDLNVEIFGAPLQIKRVLQNLIQNGFKHASHKLHVSYVQDNDQIQLNIEDDGEGILDEHKEHVFTPFIRLDSSRNKKTGGFGLGLAIVERICKSHDVQVWVEDGALGGARFCLKFPHAHVHTMRAA